MSSKCIAYGSTSEITASRARSGVVGKIIPVAGCVARLYASVPLAGRSNVVRVEYRVAQQEPVFMYKTSEHFFSFDDAESCDFFLKQLQVRSSSSFFFLVVCICAAACLI